MSFSRQIVFLATMLIAALFKESESICRYRACSSSSFYKKFKEAYVEAKLHRQYDEAYSYIQELASNGNNEESNIIMLVGLNTAMDYIRLSSDAVYEGLRIINDSIGKASTQTLLQILETTFAKANANLIISGTKAYLMLGTLTELSGAYEGLNKATQFITSNGDILFSCYDTARAIAIEGIVSEKHAAFHGILAALKAVQSTEEGIYQRINEASELIYDSLYREQSESPKVNAAAARRSPECLRAIKSIQILATKAFGYINSQFKLRAINIVLDGFVDTLKSIASAAQPSYQAIDLAYKIQNKEFGIRKLKNGFTKSNKEFIAAISIAQQYLGVTWEIIGPQYEEPIMRAMVMVAKARMDLLKGLENSKLIAIQGIRMETIENALSAARYGVDTAVFAAYGEIVSSAEVAMKTIVSAKRKKPYEM